MDADGKKLITEVFNADWRACVAHANLIGATHTAVRIGSGDIFTIVLPRWSSDGFELYAARPWHCGELLFSGSYEALELFIEANRNDATMWVTKGEVAPDDSTPP